MTQWPQLLKSLGFSESETTIYLTSLEIGPASIQDLARRAKVSRVTAYAVMESLMKQGLMSRIEKGKKSLYTVESPERLVSFVQSRVKNLEATLREIQSSLDDLKLLQRGEKPSVKLFEGLEALKAIEDDVINSRPKEMDEFGNLDEIRRLYPPEQRLAFFEALAKIDPKSRAIFLVTGKPPFSRLARSETVVLAPDQFNFFGDVLVYSNKIAFSTFRGKQISVLIESEELARTMRAMFEYLWHCVAQLPK